MNNYCIPFNRACFEGNEQRYIAEAIARGHISGDGGFGYNIMELETAVRLNLPVVNIIVNNQCLGMERRGYVDYAGEVPPDPVTFSPQDFSKIAQAFHCFGARAERPGDIRGAIAAALASGMASTQ